MHLCGERIQYYFSIFLIRSEEMFVNLLLDRSFFFVDFNNLDVSFYRRFLSFLSYKVLC